MQSRLVLALSVTGVLGAAAPALAQGTIGPFAKPAYPTSLVKRPLTLSAGMLEITPVVAYSKLSIEGMSADAIDSAVALRYGILDELSAIVATSVLIDPELEWGEQVVLGLATLAYDSDRIDVAPSVLVPLEFSDGFDVQTVVVGADTRLVAHERLFFRAGGGLIPIQVDPFALDIDINVGVGLQLTEQVAAVVDTQIASVAVTGDGNETTHVGDFVPLLVTALFAINWQVDLFVQGDLPSVEDAADLYTILGGANFRL